MTTWAVTDALRIYHDGALVAEIPIAKFPALILDLARGLRG
jgi:hypothetical protein